MDIHQEVDERVADSLRARLFGDLPGFKSKNVHALQHADPGDPPSSKSPAAAQPAPERPTTDPAVVETLQKVSATREQMQISRGRDTRKDKKRPRDGSRNSSRGSSRPGTPNRRRSIPADWPGGCFHCGKSGHTRGKGCKDFEAWKGKHGVKKVMKLPSFYEGELEKFINNKTKRVNAFVQEDADEALKNLHNQTCTWMFTGDTSAPPPTSLPSSAPRRFEHKNTYIPPVRPRRAQ